MRVRTHLPRPARVTGGECGRVCERLARAGTFAANRRRDATRPFSGGWRAEQQGEDIVSHGHTARTDFRVDYAQGIPDELPVRPVDGDPARLEGARAMPAEPLALRGCVITPRGVIDDGYVVIRDARIEKVVETSDPPPDGVRSLPTDGVILPGLLDLHNHPEYNIFPAWEPAEQFGNRYAWQASPSYRELIVDPQDRLLGDGYKPMMARYGEIRALIGGVTAIQGVGKGPAGVGAPLVRNVDLPIFNRHRARSWVFLKNIDAEGRRRLRDDIAADKVTAFYVHLAEGTDADSTAEFDDLYDSELLTKATVIIHGTALSRLQLEKVAEAKAKLVWSPQSNLRLYGETTDAARAIRLGIPVGLGADWMPSGSQSLLAELKVARRVLARQGLTVESKTLVDMVTTQAAEIAGLGDQLGALEAGRPADLLVLERRLDGAFDNVVQADPSWVELVMIGGDLTYGRAEWIRELLPPRQVAELESLSAWGKEMLLDSHFAEVPDPGAPRLAQLRTQLGRAFSRLGPIFA
jgi:5-methylthioadenosine/S-adenosylhomocysteine deaminase